MRSLRHWSGARIGVLAGAWAIGLPLVSALLATLQARRELRAHALRSGTSLPSPTTDVIVAVAWRELVVLGVLAVVPPLLLFMAWRWARARGEGDRGSPT